MRTAAVKKIVRRGAKRVESLVGPKVSPVLRTAAAHISSLRSAKRLVDSGLFDQEYYEAQCGLQFASGELAARDYLRRGAECLLAPNPLLEPRWFDPAGKRGAAISTLHYAQHGPGRLGVGPLFDEQRYLLEFPDANEHPGRALGHFLAHVEPDTVLPVPSTFLGTAPHWARVRATLLSVAREYASHDALRAGVIDRSWQTASGVSLVADLAGQPEADLANTIDPATGAFVDVVMIVSRETTDGQIATSLASLKAQTLSKWRLLATVDANRPVPSALLDAASDRRIQIAKIDGIVATTAEARNTAIAFATAPYVAFLEPGHRLDTRTLRVLVNAATRSRNAAVCCASEALKGGVPQTLRAHSRGANWLRWYDTVDTSTLLVELRRLRELGGFSPDLLSGEVHELALRLEAVEPIQFVPFVGVTYEQTASVAPFNWAAIGRHHVDWNAMAAGLAGRVHGRITVSMPTYRDWKMTLRAVQRVLATAGTHDVEVVVVDNGSHREVGAILTAAFLGDARVRVVSLPINLNYAIGSNLGAALGSGDLILFLNNDTEVLDGWLDPLVAHIAEPATLGVQPLLLYSDGTIQSAGSTLPGTGHPPTSFLTGFLPEDAKRCGDIRLRIVTAAALLMRASDVVELRGFDPAFVNGQEDVDLCLRAVRRWDGRFIVATNSVVVHHESKSQNRGAMIQQNRRLLVDRWKDALYDSDLDAYALAGFTVTSLDYGAALPQPWMVPLAQPVLARAPRTVVDGPAAGLASLRWALKIAAHPGPRGDGWGDVHFAAALGRSLERLGQEVVVDRRESRQRRTNSIDQVAVVVRGLERVHPVPGQVSILWVISHPEMVSDDELAAFDVVFAASSQWAQATSTRTGLDVRPLLQATEPDRFHPGLRCSAASSGPLFVGRSRNILRPIVRDAVKVGVDIEIYGDGWEQFGLADHVRGEYLPYETVGRAYASADIVLNDHWADMAEQGFVSNRVFDAVACGARVVSDDVAGLEELFSGSVRVYRSPEDLVRLCGEDGRDLFADDATRISNALSVAEHHSFDARAEELLRAALSVREQRGWRR